MGGASHWKLLAAAAAGATGLAAASPALAGGRCGGSYAVDAPTTLTAVARRCNVNLSALYEANPGVDPSDVRPGARLAVPDEIDSYASGSSTSDDGAASSSADAVSDDYHHQITDDYGMSGPIDEDRNDDALIAHRIRARDARVSADNPLWLQPETISGSRYSINDRLSYQKLSAARIHSAGVPSYAEASPVEAVPARLIECPVLRAEDGGKIHQVRQIISTPETTFVEIKDTPDGSGFDCTLVTVSDAQAGSADKGSEGVPPARFTSPPSAPRDYRLPDYGRIGVTPKAVKVNDTFSLKGEVVDSDQGCLLLKTSDNHIWRLSAAPPAGDLIGKKVTVWGKATAVGSCGDGASMLVTHAVYAEPWRPER